MSKNPSSSLRICFDLRPLQIGHENRGIGMHIKSILANLPDESHYTYIFYYFDDYNPVKKLAINMSANYESITTPRLRTSVGGLSSLMDVIKLASHRFSELKNNNVDVFIQFDFMLGLPKNRNMRRIIIGYDLIPLIFKNEYIPDIPQALAHAYGKKAKVRAVLRSVYYQFRYKLSYTVFRRADRILAISESARQSFVSLLNIPSAKIRTIPLAPVVLSNEADFTIAKSVNKQYILYIGGTDSRKRIEDVVSIYNIVRGRGADVALVLAGNEFEKTEMIPSIPGKRAIQASPYKDDIHLMGFVTDKEKNGLYKKASCFVFTSVYEGFGLPILEAMLAGCPVVCYDNSSIPESSGGFAVTVNSRDFTAAAGAILSELTRKSKAQNNRSVQGKKYAKSLSWSCYVDALLDNVGKI